MSRKLNIVDLMGGIGVGTKSIINRAGRDNVNIVSYIDNEYKNKWCNRVYNLYFGTDFKPSDINTFNFYSIKDVVDIAVASFPSNTFIDKNYSFGYVSSPRLFEPINIPRLSTPTSVYEFCRVVKPRALFIDLTVAQNNNQQMKNLDDFLKKLGTLGYTYAGQFYNAYDFNAPQDRERLGIMCFNSCVKLHRPFLFPDGVKTKKKIRDILVDKFEQKYVISDKDWNEKYSKSTKVKPINNIDGFLNTITANYDVKDKGYSAIVPCNCGSKHRFLKPLEVFRAMGLTDDYFYSIKDYFSDSELYRLAGNSMIGFYCDSIMQKLLNLSEFRVWE